MIYARKLDLHQEMKRVRNKINEGLIKLFLSCFNCSKNNRLFKATIFTMDCVFTAYIIVYSTCIIVHV